MTPILQVEDSDAAYLKIASLPEADPIRKTVEMALRASYGEAAKHQLEQLQYYLQDYLKADDILKRQMGVASYSAQLVQLMQHTVWQLLKQC